MSYFAILEHLEVVAIEGEDAAEFISNQFTSDTNQIKHKEIHQSAWCDPKGRVLFAPVLFKHNDGYRCLLPKDLATQFCQRLKMFVLRSQVSIQPLHDLSVGGMVLDNGAPVVEGEQAQVEVLEIPPANTASERISRYYLIGDAELIKAFAADRALPRNDRQWQRDQMINGIAEINVAVSGEFLPQELNFDALNAVSFQKGCYPGQEIIARLKYRGKVKKRLCPLVCDSEDITSIEFAALDKVHLADNPDSSVGKVLSGLSEDRKHYALAVIDAELVENGNASNQAVVSIGEQPGLFSILPPPYPLPE